MRVEVLRCCCAPPNWPNVQSQLPKAFLWVRSPNSAQNWFQVQIDLIESQTKAKPQSRLQWRTFYMKLWTILLTRNSQSNRHKIWIQNRAHEPEGEFGHRDHNHGTFEIYAKTTFWYDALWLFMLRNHSNDIQRSLIRRTWWWEVCEIGTNETMLMLAS